MIASRVLDELKERLSAAYGERLHAVVLFGSEARGDARPDSDIDVLVVLETLTGDYGERTRAGTCGGVSGRPEARSPREREAAGTRGV